MAYGLIIRTIRYVYSISEPQFSKQLSTPHACTYMQGLLWGRLDQCSASALPQTLQLPLGVLLILVGLTQVLPTPLGHGDYHFLP